MQASRCESPHMNETDKQTFPYKVIAVSASRFHMSRHGISTSKGGDFVASETFTWPQTPVWEAEQYMKDRFPNCDIQTKHSKAAIEFSQRDQ